MTAARRDTRVYLQDMLAAIERIAEYGTRGRERFFRDSLLQDGIIRQLSIVGEAASKLTRETKARAPDIPWRSIVGMRNIIIHDYSEIKLERVWETVEKDLPVLRKAVTALLRQRTVRRRKGTRRAA